MKIQCGQKKQPKTHQTNQRYASLMQSQVEENKESVSCCNSKKQTTGILISATVFWSLTQRGKQILHCTFQSVMEESLDAVTTMSSCLLEWRPQILSSWPSNVFTHSFVLIVQSFKRPSEPLLEEKNNKLSSENHGIDPFLLCPNWIHLDKLIPFQCLSSRSRINQKSWESLRNPFCCQYY